MRKTVIKKDGYNYKWIVQGLNEGPCIKDIESNNRIELTDYVAIMFSERYGCVADVQKVREMTHNQYQEFLKNNSSRLYNEKGYTMDDFKRDADSVVILDFDLDRFNLTDDIKKFINISFSSESVNKNGHMYLSGRSEFAYAIADKLGCECVSDGAYNGFFKNDDNRLVFEFCEGDIYLTLCENEKEYRAELESYYKFYGVDTSLYELAEEQQQEDFFEEGAFNLYRDGVFQGKAFSEKEANRFILMNEKEHPNSTLSVTKCVKNGDNFSFIDVSLSFFDKLNDRLPSCEDNACIEVYFDGVLVDNVYTSMDKAEGMEYSLVQLGYDDYNGDVKEDWESSGGRSNPDISFRVVEYPEKTVEGLIASATEPSFIDDLMNDKVVFSDIDKYVEYWHNHETGKTLQEFLGLTDDEYEEWGKSSNESVENLILNAKGRSEKTGHGEFGKEEYVKE